MGRRLDALEERLGVKLLVRTTRKLTLTHEGRDVFARRAVYGGTCGVAQLGNAAYMIAMVMGHYNGLQMQPERCQRLFHGRGLPGVDHQRLPAVVQQPDIVIGKCGQRVQVHE